MTLEKAIEIKELHREGYWPEDNPDVMEADRLSLEAMKEAQRWRAGQPLHLPNLLPGETAD